MSITTYPVIGNTNLTIKSALSPITEITVSQYLKSNIEYTDSLDFHLKIFLEDYPDLVGRIGYVTTIGFSADMTAHPTKSLAFEDNIVRHAYETWLNEYSRFFNNPEEISETIYPKIRSGMPLDLVKATKNPATVSTLFSFGVSLGSGENPRDYSDEWKWIVRNCNGPVFLIRDFSTGTFWAFGSEEDGIKFKLTRN